MFLLLVVNISHFHKRTNSACPSTLKNIVFFCLHLFCLSFVSMHQRPEKNSIETKVNLPWDVVSLQAHEVTREVILALICSLCVIL